MKKLRNFMIKISTPERSFSRWCEKTWSASETRILGSVKASLRADDPISFNLKMVEYTNLLKAAVGHRLRSKLYYNRMSDL